MSRGARQQAGPSTSVNLQHKDAATLELILDPKAPGTADVHMQHQLKRYKEELHVQPHRAPQEALARQVCFTFRAAALSNHHVVLAMRV